MGTVYTMTSSSSSQTSSPAVTVELASGGRVAVLTLNRPKTLNKMDGEIMRGIGEAVDLVVNKHLSTVGCVVLRGAGSSFCAGGDLGWLAKRCGSHSSGPRNSEIMRQFYDLVVQPLRKRLPVPTLAVIHGAAVGAGLSLGLLCDIRVFSGADVRVGLPFVGLGLTPGMGSTTLLPAIV